MEIDKWCNIDYIHKMMKKWNMNIDDASRKCFMNDLNVFYKIIKLDLTTKQFTEKEYNEIKNCYEERIKYAISQNWFEKRNGTYYDDIIYII